MASVDDRLIRAHQILAEAAPMRIDSVVSRAQAGLLGEAADGAGAAAHMQGAARFPGGMENGIPDD